MRPEGRRRFKRFAVSTTVAVGATVAAGYALGAPAGAIVAALGFLGTAIAADDKLGTCLPLAVLSLIIAALVVMALYAAVMVGGS